MDILISAVGLRDPYAPNGSEGPALTAIKKIMPDICFLFGTAPGINEEVANTYQDALKIKEIVQKEIPSIKVVPIPLDLNDPTSYKEILIQFEKHIQDIINKYKQSRPGYHVNISSGTAQMHTSLLVLINSGRLKTKNIYQVKDPKYVKAGEERVIEIDVKYFEEENYIRRAKKLFERYDFKEAGEELIELASFTIRETREKRAITFALLCEAYDYWDRYEHKKALESLKAVRDDVERFKITQLSGLVSEQITILSQIVLDGDKESYHTLNDLLHNAWRRKDEGRYMDCLMRYKRLIDGLASLKCGLIGHKEIKHQPKWVKDILHDKKDSDNLYYSDFLRLYKAKCNTEMLSNNLEQEIRNLNVKRNTCAAAHGMGVVGEKDAYEALNILWKVAEKLFPEKDWKNYVFSVNKVKEISEILFNLI